MTLDAVDLRILRELQADASLSKQQTREALDHFESAICAHDEVMECYLMTGDADDLIRVAVPDMAALERFIIERISPLPQVEKIRSSFALKQVRYKTALPLVNA